MSRDFCYKLRDYNDAMRTAKNLLSLGASNITVKTKHDYYLVKFTGNNHIYREGRSGVKYTQSEDCFIVNYYLSGYPVSYICHKTHRKYSSIENRLRKHGFYLIHEECPDADKCAKLLISMANGDKLVREDFYFPCEFDFDEFIRIYEEEDYQSAADKSGLSLNFIIENAAKLCIYFKDDLQSFQSTFINFFAEHNDLKSQIALYRHLNRYDDCYKLLLELSDPITNIAIKNILNRLSYAACQAIWYTYFLKIDPCFSYMDFHEHCSDKENKELVEFYLKNYKTSKERPQGITEFKYLRGQLKKTDAWNKNLAIIKDISRRFEEEALDENSRYCFASRMLDDNIWLKEYLGYDETEDLLQDIIMDCMRELLPYNEDTIFDMKDIHENFTDIFNDFVYHRLINYLESASHRQSCDDDYDGTLYEKYTEEDNEYVSYVYAKLADNAENFDKEEVDWGNDLDDLDSEYYEFS